MALANLLFAKQHLANKSFRFIFAVKTVPYNECTRERQLSLFLEWK